MQAFAKHASAVSDFFVSTDWLAANLGQPDLVIVDGSFVLPGLNRNTRAEYLAAHIPGAVFFDIDEIADRTTGLPHMLPKPAAFAAAMRELGINERARIVVYDSAGLKGAPRVWWTLRTFGAGDVRILAGGLPQWKSEGRPIESGAVSRGAQEFTPQFDAAKVAGVDDVAAAMRDGSAQIVDARSAARFHGTAPEPRPGLRSGHIPDSRNVPWPNLIAEGRLRDRAAVTEAFAAAGVDLERPLITTCGSGVTAAILLLALASIGKDDVRLYDGSWSQWGARTDLPVEAS